MNYKEVLKCLKMPNYVSNDFYSMLFARSIGGTAGYDELTGTPPLTFTANGRNLINYRIYGANDGVGEQTENLFDKDAQDPDKGYMNSILMYADGSTTSNAGYRVSEYISVASNTDYYLTDVNGNGTYPSVCFYDENKVYISGIGYNRNQSLGITTPSGTAYLRMTTAKYLTSVSMITEGSTAPAQYIPFGYQINAEVGDGVTTTDIPIYIGDTPLAQGEYVDYGEQKVYKYVDGTLTPTDPPVALLALPTIDGATIVDFDNTPKPSEMYIKYPK